MKPTDFNDDDLTEDELDEWLERQAIMQYDGGMTRFDAEDMALKRVLSKRKKPGQLDLVSKERKSHE